MSATTDRAPHWSTLTVNRLRDTTKCPVCSRRLVAGVCSQCGADLRGDAGIEVWRSATAAADALTALQATVARVPRRALQRATPVATSDPAPARPTPPVAAPPAAPRASTTLQSVLAVAGAGLIGLAAIVFTLLNPDLTDPAARGAILVVALALFSLAAPALMRRGLRVSAECIGALALVFAALAGSTLAPVLAPGVEAWPVTTALALLGGAVALSFGLRSHLRVWMLTGSLALTVVPLLASVSLGGLLPSLWGPLGTAFVALALLEGATAFESRRSLALRIERLALVGAQVVGFIALAAAAFAILVEGDEQWLALSAALLGAGAVAARSAGHAPRRLWSFAAGASAPAALVLASFAIDTSTFGAESARIVLIPTAAIVGLLLVAAFSSARSAAHRGSVLAGTMSVAALSITPHAALAGLGALGALLGAEWLSEATLDADSGVAVVLSLVIASVGLAAQARLLMARAGRATRSTAVRRATAFWLLGLAGLGALGLTVVDASTRAIAAIVVVAAIAAVLSGVDRARRSPLADRAPIVLAAHLALIIAVSLSWQSVPLAVSLGSAALVALAALARTVPRVLRPAHLAVGYAYALVLIASALSLASIEGPAQLSLTATAGLLVAIAATFARRLDAVRWITILVVSIVPSAMAVALVVVERSGWVALSTSTMIVLALSLLLTRRPGLGIVIRALAGALIVPAIAVVLVNLGAQLLVTSGSPVVLPAIAAVVALTLPVIPHAVALLRARGMSAEHATAVGDGIEFSTLLTASIAVLLSFAREAAGAPTALSVFALLAVGAAVAAAVRRRPLYWWMSGATTTAALWCLLQVLDVTSLEAHLLPPTLGAAAVAAVLTARGTPRSRLYGGALLAAIVPLLAVLALAVEAAPVRAIGLVAASVALTGLGAGIRALDGRLAALATPTLLAAIVAGLAGAAQAARIGLGIDAVATTAPTVIIVIAIAAAGALPAGIAGLLLARGADAAQRRWSLVPAISAVTVASWTAVAVDEFTVAVLWSLMLALLITMVAAVARERLTATNLPRSWVLFALALATAIAAWSTREYLRVEAFSLPLGAMLLIAGALAMRHVTTPSVPLHHWPAGRTGSWQLLAPGLVVLVFASMLATATDPQTWRAVLVMAIALVAIIVGVRWRLAAPFVLGIVVLPIENVLAFSVQIGRGIEAMPWWITLAVVGLVLLVIAVGSERRGGDDRASSARLRDLR
ncbi:SCO7613 C-terminal domain-containing membrane protein [Microcella sp.]|uniref:SCO7613 C-terminal domain-containing membrane protein n=1 Tax=Microcella sp. TaxID=1913979 RepID=UPI002560A778|nr:hypothetical protein [Microcella sp.]MBX9472515.1 hypothetical protein [Microcella sp.]